MTKHIQPQSPARYVPPIHWADELTDADATLLFAGGSFRRLPANTLTANRTLTLGTAGAHVGVRIEVQRVDATAYSVAFVNGGAGAGTLLTMAGGAAANAVFEFNGANWVLQSSCYSIGSTQSALSDVRFVFQPNGTTGAGIYATWAALVAAVASVNGQRVIEIDDSLSAGTATIPVGAWDFNPAGISGDVTIRSRNAGASGGAGFQTALTTAAGAVSLNGLTALEDVYIVNQSTLDLITVTTNTKFRVDGYGACYQNNSSGAFFKRTAGTLILDLAGNAVVSKFTSTQEAIQIVGTTNCFTLKLRDSAQITANQINLSGGATASVNIEGPNTSYAAQAGATTVPTGGRQSGTGTLVAGQSAAITACLASASKILITPLAPATSGSTKYIVALAADRVLGAQGSFKATAILASADTINVADVSTFHWEVIT